MHTIVIQRNALDLLQQYQIEADQLAAPVVQQMEGRKSACGSEFDRVASGVQWRPRLDWEADGRLELVTVVVPFGAYAGAIDQSARRALEAAGQRA